MAPNNPSQVLGYLRRCAMSQCNKELFERTSHWPDLCFYIFLNSNSLSKVKCPSTVSTFYSVLGGGPVIGEQMKCQRARRRLWPLWPGWLPPQQRDGAGRRDRAADVSLSRITKASGPHSLHSFRRAGGLLLRKVTDESMNLSGGGWELG